MAVVGRQAALDNALNKLKKIFGKGVMRLAEAADRMNVEVISSGSLTRYCCCVVSWPCS